MSADSITSVAARTVIEAAGARGFSTSSLYDVAGLDPDQPPDAGYHISADRYFAVWEKAMQLVQDSSFPARVGAGFDIESLEAFGFLAMSCNTLGDAYERTAAVRDLYNVGSRWDLEMSADRMRMKWVPWSVSIKSDLAVRSVNEYQVAEMLGSIRQLTGRPLAPRRIAFRHSAPRDRGVAFEELLGCKPEYESDFDGFDAELGWLGEPLRNKNPKLRDYFVKQCELAVVAFASDPPVTAQVRQLLAAAMDGQLPHMASVAKSLGTSPRSLHRRLGEEGTKFNDLLDEVRRDFAERYLTRPKMSVSEVAYLIGFNDSSAFLKAFKRWKGVTPSEYRSGLARNAAR